MFLTMRAVWALLPGIVLALIAPRPAAVLAWPEWSWSSS